jgi:teichuronic acid exporter
MGSGDQSKGHSARALGATWWSAVEICSRYGVQFFVLLFLARILLPSDFGLSAMLLVFTSIGALLVDSGFSASLVQRQQTSVDDETTVFWFSAFMGALLFMLLWFSAPLIANFFAQPELVSLTRMIAWVLPIGALSSVPDACLTQKLRFKARAKAQVVSAIGSAIVAVVLAVEGYGVWSLVWQAVTAAGLRGILLWAFSGWWPSGRFRLSSLRQLSRYGGYMLLAGLLDTVTVRLQSLLVGRFFDARTLGIYTLAQSAQGAPTSLIGAILSRVGLPVFASVAHQPDKLVNALRLSLRISLFAFVPCMIGMALSSAPLIELLYGKRWIEAAPILSLLALAGAFWPQHVLNLAALNAQGHSNLFFRLELVKKAIALTLIIAFSPGGPIAIAMAVLLSSLVGLAANTWYSGKFLGYGFRRQFIDQLPTLALTLVAASIGWAILHWTTPALGHTALAIACAGFVYTGLAWFFRHPVISDLQMLARDFRQTTDPVSNPPRA